MCTDLLPHVSPRIVANSRGVTILNSPTLPRTSKSRSPVIRYSHPALAPSLRMRSSSGSRHSGGGCAESVTGVVRFFTYLANRLARLGEYRNFFTSFSSTSRTTGRPEKTSHCLSIRLQSRRQNPRRAVRTDSQTLLSRRTRIRRGHARKFQNLFLGHLHIEGQRVRPFKEIVVGLFHQPTHHLRAVFRGQLLNLFDDLLSRHARKLAPGSGSSSLLSP